MTPTKEAILLLTTSLGGLGLGTTKPLTPTEWGAFATWMIEHDLDPGDLLRCDLPDVLGTWEHKKVTISRIQSLLNRGAALGFALEKWERAGLWVVTRGDANYPKQLKRRLGSRAPATLFGCGSVDLLKMSSIAIVGSRHAADNDICFAEEIGRHSAERGEGVVSGGAAGIDRAAMFGALNADGNVIGVLAENLLRTTTLTEYRRHLIAGNLALVSPSDPEARFTVASAMERNKYIYCLAHDAIVVASTPERGGTWRGAVENLKHGWVPLRVKKTEAPDSGNRRLVDLGGHWLDDLEDVAFGEHSEQPNSKQGTDQRLKTAHESTEIAKADLKREEIHKHETPEEESSLSSIVESPSRVSGGFTDEGLDEPSEELYAKVRTLVSKICIEPKQANEIADALRVTKPTVDAWIKRLVDERVLKRIARPVRYVTCEKDLLEVTKDCHAG